MMIESVILLAVQLIGGDNSSFETALAHIPTDQISEQTAAEHTPGSTAWYDAVENIRIPQHWAVYSNGYPVVAGSADINREPEVVRSPGDGLFDLVVRCADGLERDFRPAMFMVRWSLGHHAVATNYTDYSCVSAYGHPLSWMKSHKLDRDLYGAYFSSYNAYFERIYFGGMREGSTFEGPAWFLPNPGSQFMRNGPTNDWHRLLEYPIITNFMAAVGRMRGNLKAELPPNDMSPNYNHPSFYTGTGGILDNQVNNGSNYAHVYWASTFHPPLIEQNVGEVTNEVMRLPDAGKLGKLMPEFDWEETAIAKRDLNNDLVESHFWQCYAPTLDGLFDETDVFTESPVRHLFEIVGVADTAGPADFVRGYKCRSMYDLMTNVYPFACMSAASVARSLPAYRKCYGEDAHSRKVLPGAFVGANHTFGVMNRMIYVPTIGIRAEHGHSEAQVYAELEATHELEIGLTFDSVTRRWKLDREMSDVTFTASKEFFTSDWTTFDPKVLPYLELSVSPVTYTLGDGFSTAEGYGTVILLMESHAQRMFEQSGATDYLDIDGAFPVTGALGGWDIQLQYAADNGTPGAFYLGIGGQSGMFRFKPKVTMRARYETIVNKPYVFNHPVENHLPTPVTTDRVVLNKIAFLDRRDFDFVGTTTQYRSLGEDTVTGWIDPFYDHERALRSELNAEFAARVGRDYDRPEEMVRVPDSVTLKFDAGNSYVEDESDVAVTLPFSYDHKEPAYSCDLHTANSYQFDQSNVVDRTSGGVSTNWWETFAWYEQTEEGWVFARAETNYVNGTWDEIETTVVTNDMSEPMLAFTGFMDTTEIVPKRKLGDTVLSYDIHYQTNYITGAVDYWVDETYDFYTNHVCHIDPIEGEIWDDPTTDMVHLKVVSKDDVGTQRESYEAFKSIDLTGEEVVNLATNVTEIQEITACSMYWRIYRDNRVESWYYHPHTGERTVVNDTTLPIPIATYTAKLKADVDNAYHTVDIDAFTEGFDCKVKYSVIESADFKWKSMNASE